jgi:hypothetical protein
VQPLRGKFHEHLTLPSFDGIGSKRWASHFWWWA